MNRGPFTNSVTSSANSGRIVNGQQPYDTSADAIEQRLHQYLKGPEVKNILTPGEYSEWPLTLKAGQVVISEARSPLADCSPMTQRTLSDTLVLPQPLGPTTAVTPGSKRSSVLSAKDLKP